MTSISFTRSEPPEVTRPEWQWGGPKPEGYEWPAATLTPGLTLSCLTCGAAVEPRMHERHTAWHVDRP